LVAKNRSFSGRRSALIENAASATTISAMTLLRRDCIANHAPHDGRICED
jgi:hypothetical protein